MLAEACAGPRKQARPPDVAGCDRQVRDSPPTTPPSGRRPGVHRRSPKAPIRAASVNGAARPPGNASDDRSTPPGGLRDHAHPTLVTPGSRRQRSLREGMEETLTVVRLGIRGKLKRTLASTNPCESMIDCVRFTQRNVKRWSSGEMGLRWTAAGMLEAERQFRKVIGYRDLAKLAIAIERNLTLPQPQPPTQEARIAVTV
jgi:hypothetical protein